MNKIRYDPLGNSRHVTGVQMGQTTTEIGLHSVCCVELFRSHYKLTTYIYINAIGWIEYGRIPHSCLLCTPLLWVTLRHCTSSRIGVLFSVDQAWQWNISLGGFQMLETTFCILYPVFPCLTLESLAVMWFKLKPPIWEWYTYHLYKWWELGDSLWHSFRPITHVLSMIPAR